MALDERQQQEAAHAIEDTSWEDLTPEQEVLKIAELINSVDVELDPHLTTGQVREELVKLIAQGKTTPEGLLHIQTVLKELRQKGLLEELFEAFERVKEDVEKERHVSGTIEVIKAVDEAHKPLAALFGIADRIIQEPDQLDTMIQEHGAEQIQLALLIVIDYKLHNLYRPQ